MHFDHLGYAVRDLDEALGQFEGIFGETLNKSARYFEPTFDSHIQFIQPGGQGPRIELIAPASESSLVGRILAKRGPGVYHFCYQVDDLAAETSRLKKQGFRATTEPCSARAFAGRRVQFFFHPQLGLLELLESAAQT